MFSSVYVLLSTYPYACRLVFSEVLGGTDLSKQGWGKAFVASVVVNESPVFQLGQLLNLWLCKTEGKL